MFLILQIVVYFSISQSSKIAPAFYGLERPALEYELPPLLYSFDELEPYMDEASAKMHYFEYHAQYVSNVNALLKKWRRNTKVNCQFFLCMIFWFHLCAYNSNSFSWTNISTQCNIVNFAEKTTIDYNLMLFLKINVFSKICFRVNKQQECLL